MAATVTGVVEALKYRYASPERMRYLFADESVTREILGKRTQRADGRGKLITPLTVKNPTGFKGGAEGGAIASARDPDTAEATHDVVEYTGTYETSWKLLDNATRDKAAFIKVTSWLTESLRKHMMRMLNADLLSNGLGKLGTLPGADNTSSPVCAEVPAFSVGMIVDWMDAGDNDTKHGDSLAVNDVDPTTKEVTLSGALSSTAAGDYATIEDTVASGFSYHSHGLLGIIDTDDPPSPKGNFGNIDRDTAGNTFWKGIVLANGGTNRPLSEDLLIQGADNARLRGTPMFSHLMSGQAIARRYHAILSAQRFMTLGFGAGGQSGGVGRKNMGKEPRADGKTVYDFGGIPWHVDVYFPANTMVGINVDDWFLGVGKFDEPRPVDEWFPGQVEFFKRGSNTTFSVEFYYLMELICDAPNRQVKWEDIAE